MGGKNDKTWQTALHAFTEWNAKQRVLVWLLNYRCWFYACIKYAFVLDCYFLSKGWPWKEWPVDRCPKRGSHVCDMVSSAQFSWIVMSDSAIPWTVAYQVSLSITNPWRLLKLLSIKSVMSYNHLNLCRPLLFLPSTFPRSGAFPMSQFFTSGGKSIEASVSASVLPMNVQDWFSLGWTGLISLQSRSLLQQHTSKASILQHSASL